MPQPHPVMSENSLTPMGEAQAAPVQPRNAQTHQAYPIAGYANGQQISLTYTQGTDFVMVFTTDQRNVHVVSFDSSNPNWESIHGSILEAGFSPMSFSVYLVVFSGNFRSLTKDFNTMALKILSKKHDALDWSTINAKSGAQLLFQVFGRTNIPPYIQVAGASYQIVE